MSHPQDRNRRRMMLASIGSMGALASPSTVRAAAWALTTYRSPALQPFVEDLPYLAPMSAPTSLTLSAGSHRFHRDLPLDRVLRIGDQSYLGPTLEAHRDQATRISFSNRLQNHPFAEDVDTALMGATELDKICPRSTIHLHGGMTAPDSDGHPMATTRHGFERTHTYCNRQDATGMWYHDHTLGLTRLNVVAGLAGQYLLRDDFDTGLATNRLGLPCGEFELPIVLQDRIFSKTDGKVLYRTTTYVPQGDWEGAQYGDVPVVNGKVMPNCKVARGLYRLRLLNASNTRTYLLSLSNGVPFIVIGSDAGMLNAPTSSRKLLLTPGERYDVLVDFSNRPPGEKVVLRNDQRLAFLAKIIGDPIITDVMQFTVQPARGGRFKVPASLRGGAGQAPLLPRLPAPTVVRNMNLLVLPKLDAREFMPVVMNLNNLPFDTTDVERPKAGAVEQWNIINTTTDDHPVHLHLARFKVIGRQPFSRLRYIFGSSRPSLGLRWAPSADPYAIGDMAPPEPWEAGFKDTVYAPPGVITRLLVQWPTMDEMGFDPDGPVQVPDKVMVGAPGNPDPLTSGSVTRPPTVNAVCTTQTNNGVMRLNPAIQDSATTVRGYVWHCHVPEHEDHDMMLPVRIQKP